MSLDFSLLEGKPREVFSANITHNLTSMAEEAGLYDALWHPENIGAVYARDIIQALEDGHDLLLFDEDRFTKYDAPNGWGTYEHFVPFVKECLDACRAFPEAIIESDV